MTKAENNYADAYREEAQELLAIVQAYANKTAWKTAPTVTTADGLSDYLAGKFGPSCQTSLGPTPVTIDVYENTTIDSPEDYSVLVDLDPGFVYDLQSSIKITTAMNHKVSLELKQFMEDIARAAIAAAPGKKLNGCLVKNNRNFALFETYHNWANYAPDGVYATYDSAKVTKFHWQADQDFLYR